MIISCYTTSFNEKDLPGEKVQNGISVLGYTLYLYSLDFYQFHEYPTMFNPYSLTPCTKIAFQGRAEGCGQSLLRRVPDGGELHRPQHRRGRRRAEPQRPVRPLTEHHQREDLPRHLVVSRLRHHCECAKMQSTIA